ncbi:hypothetical protein LCGC14_1259450, partial [marine sediment metagenome]
LPRPPRRQRGAAHRAEAALAARGALCGAGGTRRGRRRPQGRVCRQLPRRPEAPADRSTPARRVETARLRSRTPTRRREPFRPRTTCALCPTAQLRLPVRPLRAPPNVPAGPTATAVGPSKPTGNTASCSEDLRHKGRWSATPEPHKYCVPRTPRPRYSDPSSPASRLH